MGFLRKYNTIFKTIDSATKLYKLSKKNKKSQSESNIDAKASKTLKKSKTK